MGSIATQLQQTRDRITKARMRFHREDTVQLLAVSKTKSAEQVREAFQSGQRAFGENYVQEGVDKVQALAELDGIAWHFIGPLQANKSRLVAEHFHWVHSVDRLKIARRLSDQRPAGLPPINICLQVNIDNQPSKSGLTPAELPAIAAQVIDLPNITLRGLMAIPAPRESEAEQRQPLGAVHKLFKELQSLYPDQPLDTLSMGMSNDMDAAIAEGATIVRIGTAIFGARDYSPDLQR